MKSSLMLLLLYVWALNSLCHQSVVNEQCPERIPDNDRRRTCSKKCQWDNDCGNKRQCLCDGLCGLSCVAPGRTCPWPLPAGDNFSVTLLFPAPSFSALLEVRCHFGYTMANGLNSTLRRCQGDRQWSGDDPVCISKNAEPEPVAEACPLPDDERLMIRGSTAVGTTIEYQCSPGSVLVGIVENTCHKNQIWAYPHPICQSVFCPPPVEVTNGYLVAVQKSVYSVGNAIYYLCKKTFILDGQNQVTCQSDGTWSTVPFCRARCPIPAQRSRVIVGGIKLWPHDLTDGVVAHGENVTFFCNHPHKHCSFTATETCFDGQIPVPACYLEPTWLQYNLYSHRVVSEIGICDPADLV